MKSVWKTFHSRYGRVQIQFSTPISLKVSEWLIIMIQPGLMDVLINDVFLKLQSLVASAAQHQSAANHFGSGVDGYKVDGGDGLVDRRNVDFRISASNLAEEPAAEVLINWS